MSDHQHKPDTDAIHGRSDQTYRSAVYPIYQTSTFGVEHTADYNRFFQDSEPDFYIYTRGSNPTIRNVEERMAKLEHADDCLIFTSGMAAVTASIMSQVQAGGTVVASRPLYGGTYNFLMNILPRYGVKTVILDPDELYDLSAHVPDADVVYFETPGNPTCICLSIPRIVEAAQKVGAVTIIDNTFASPINQTPLDLGVDIVLHSVTKYIAGHSDVIAGAIMAGQQYMEAIGEMRGVFGGCISPFDAFLLDRSLKTLPVRVRQHNINTQRIAEFFTTQPQIKQVYYPGLPGTDDHAIASEQMHGFGGMLAIELADQETAMAFCDSLKLALNAVSLGGVETLVTLPAMSTHSRVDEDEKRVARVTGATVRLSIGLEDVDDLIADFEQALAAIAPVATS